MISETTKLRCDQLFALGLTFNFAYEGCVMASVLAFLKQGSLLQQYIIAGVFETAEVYAKMAHNVRRYV